VITTLVSLLSVPATALGPASAPDTAGARSAADGAVVDDPGSTTWASIVGEIGSFVHDGRSTLATQPDWTFVVYGDVDDYVHIRIEKGIYTLAVDMAAPFGETLTVGQYDGTTEYYDYGRAGLEVSGGGRGCAGESPGSFTVHDIDRELSRLWMTFDFRCSGGGAVTGEIQLNQPRQPGFTVAPTQLSWPEQPVGGQGRPSPVTIVNTEETPLRVSSIEVTGGGSDFAVVHDTCGVLPAGGFCRAYVQSRPTSLGARAGALEVRTDRGDRLVPLTTSGDPPDGSPTPELPARVHAEQPSDDAPLVTYWGTDADSDAWVGDTLTFRERHLRYVFGTDTRFSIDANFGGPPSYWADLRSALPRVLLPGTTAPGGPGDTSYFSMSGNHRGCGGRAAASFTVHQATYNLSNELTGIALSYRYRCLGSTPYGEVRGSVAWNTTCIPAMPGSRQEGRCLPPDQVLNPPPRGRQHPGLTIRRERLGDRVWIRGRFDVPLRGQTVAVVRWTRRAWVVAGRARSDAHGRYVVVLSRPAAGKYRARWGGNRSYFAAVSPAVRIRRR
jgi:hypothetical protein